MGCCIGAKHSNWCEDYDIVYIDAEGKEYCIFHAPADCKFDVPVGEPYDERNGSEKTALMGAEQFNGLVFARIDGVIEAGVDEERDEWEWVDWNPRCNFAGTIFPYDISFSEYNNSKNKYLPPIEFSRSYFYQFADFRNIICLKQASFSNTHFKDEIDFRGAKLSNTSFTRTQFYEDTFFIDTIFSKKTNFTNAQFHKEANFYYAQFMNSVNFSMALFEGETAFSNTYFNQKTKFDTTTFKSTAIFVESKFKNAYFDNSNFIQNTYFDGSEFEKTSFNLTKFEKYASYFFTTFNDYSNFEQTIFNGGANFELAFFKEWSYFRDTKFNAQTSFAGTISKETILLESVDLSNFKFAETNIESFKFIDCNWGKERFAPIYDERNQQKTGCNDSTLAEIYRRLKRIARESADEEQTSHWHYREKEMTRRILAGIALAPLFRIAILLICYIGLAGWILKSFSLTASNTIVASSVLLASLYIVCKDIQNIPDINKAASKIYLNIYKQISGYGEEPFRAGTILFILLALPFLAQFIVSLTVDPSKAFDWIKNAMWYMPLIKVDFKAVGYQYLLKGLSVTLISLQAALFGFALRNKLRR